MPKVRDTTSSVTGRIVVVEHLTDAENNRLIRDMVA